MIVKMKNFPEDLLYRQWICGCGVKLLNTQLLVFGQLEAYFKKESATSEDIV